MNLLFSLEKNNWKFCCFEWIEFSKEFSEIFGIFIEGNESLLLSMVYQVFLSYTKRKAEQERILRLFIQQKSEIKTSDCE